MTKSTHITIQKENSFPIKAWIQGVSIEDTARQQLSNVAKLPCIHKHIAVMPDVHWGIGATVGSVIPTKAAIIPAAVGVDIGCGMMAVQTNLKAEMLPDRLSDLRLNLEKAVPHGRTHDGRAGDRGAWKEIPSPQLQIWERLKAGYEQIISAHPKLHSKRINHVNHLGTLGSGNHFIEVCLDENEWVWIMLHSGSRGIGNRIGSYFIELAKLDMQEHIKNLPDIHLAYLKEGTQFFDDYVFAVEWAQDFARINRELMMEAVVRALRETHGVQSFDATSLIVNCHHNYVAKEIHDGEEIYVTRKGAVRARHGDWGIIPGSMGARSYIVRGRGNKDSFESCSHGAGRLMSRTEARRRFSVQDHQKATEGIECRKDEDVIDETPAAYKPIDRVMEAQKDLVEIVHTLKQIICIKG